jgi:hypothetical protein
MQFQLIVTFVLGLPVLAQRCGRRAVRAGMAAHLYGNCVGSVGPACMVARSGLERARHTRPRVTRPTA